MTSIQVRWCIGCFISLLFHFGMMSMLTHFELLQQNSTSLPTTVALQRVFFSTASPQEKMVEVNQQEQELITPQHIKHEPSLKERKPVVENSESISIAKSAIQEIQSVQKVKKFFPQKEKILKEKLEEWILPKKNEEIEELTLSKEEERQENRETVKENSDNQTIDDAPQIEEVANSSLKRELMTTQVELTQKPIDLKTPVSTTILNGETGSLSAEQERDLATPVSLDSLQEKKKTESQIVMNSNGETGSLSAEQERDLATPVSLDSLQEKKKTESQIVMNSNGETGSLSAEQESDLAIPVSLDSLQEKKKTESQIVEKFNSKQVAPKPRKKLLRPQFASTPTPPVYPKRARELGQEGIVVFLVFLSKQGIISEMKISQSSGFRLLDHAAENAILQWNFAPATENGKQIESWVKIPIKFSLYQ